jgi:hypothetical protein
VCARAAFAASPCTHTPHNSRSSAIAPTSGAGSGRA